VNPVFESLIRTRNRALVARSLFLWHRIMGLACGAEPLLRQLSGIVVALPPGGDVMTHVLKINACAGGFDVHPEALPNADAIFADIPQADLRLEMTSELPPRATVLARPLQVQPALRRLRIVDGSGAPYRRRGGERFMLRYRLANAAVQTRDLLFLQIARDPGPQPGPLPPLRPWIEIDYGETSRLVETAESSAAMLVDGEAIRLSSFPVDDLAPRDGEGEVAGVYLYIELTGDVVDVALVGETLLS
jgi:hypothetical protein